MSTASIEPIDDTFDEGYEPYRAISKGAVVSTILGVFFSFGALMLPELIVFPLVGLIAGWLSFGKIRRFPTEYSGKIPAIIGIVMNGLLLVTSVTYHTISYATEVPEGYERISFSQLQPVGERPDLPVSPQALALNGKKVFIKGYVYPDGQQNNIKKFVLVPDMGTCCFGGQPKLTDMIEVTLAEPHRIRYSLARRKLAGELKVDTMLKPVSGLNGVYFQLDADHVQ